MLQLKKITKEYSAGSDAVHALRGVDISFRKNEFVSILGPSGCGKTTLLNIIGGLDRYTSGDLVINDRSTKDYRDGDWDVYRNRSIGFVFQSYNLIPHQSVLANVELALTLSGVSKSERRKRAIEALERVGLGDQIKKRPSQMSGGQMQRVAIARALVNNPDILLADEPTGALDTHTSEQVMDLLAEVAQDRLVIMVTHNPELAERYSTRIISLRDGEIVGDTAPFDPEKETDGGSDAHPMGIDVLAPVREKPKKQKRIKKKPMSGATALSLSKNNLMTKKGRTFLTSFAGSIGIIGIAMILALSTGINDYINMVQKDTLSSYPIQLMAEERDMSSMLAALMQTEEEKAGRDGNSVYVNTVLYELMTSYIGAETKKNNLAEFKKFIESSDEIAKYASAVQYGYKTPLYVFSDTEFGIRQVEPAGVFDKIMPEAMGESMSVVESMSGSSSGMQIWSEILPAKSGEGINELLEEQYILVDGRWPSAKEDIVLVLNANNEISDLSLYSLGLRDTKDVENTVKDVLAGKKDESYSDVEYTYEDMYALSFKLMLPNDYYSYDKESGTYRDMRENETFMSLAMNDPDTGLELKICGIIKPNPDAVATALSGTVGYTPALTEYVINETNASDVVKAQQADERYDVVNGLEFDNGSVDSLTDEEKKERFTAYVGKLKLAERAALYTEIMSVPSDEILASSVAQILAQYPTPEAKKAAIVAAYSQMAEMPPEAISSYIDKMSEQELDAAMAEFASKMALKSYADGIEAQLSAMTQEELSGKLDELLGSSDNAAIAKLHDAHMPSEFSDMSYAERLEALGVVDLESPNSISIFASTFDDKDEIANIISRYNDSAAEEDRINYTDVVGAVMSGVSTIINVISYVLIAFVSISLVVSSIMIGIITYISVLERTKEIGILRAIGASKGDISRVFNAETLIVGFVSGFIGIVFTILACIPANAIIQNLTGIASLEARLPVVAAAILVCISMFLTFIAGLVPAKLAANKDPVVALRSE